MKIGLLLIATNKYKIFVQPLLDGVKKNFLRDHEITVFLFTDEFGEYIGNDRVRIEQFIIPPYKFPHATLYRYKIFDEHREHLRKTDYLVYLDVDMAIVDEVKGPNFLHEVISVRHPGFYHSGWGSSGVVKESLAYVEPDKRRGYCAGGVQGGKTETYLRICNMLNARIQDDEKRGVLAEWHDESFFNWLLKSGEVPYYAPLHSGYCMVEDLERRKSWKIDRLPVFIVALNKNHAEIRA